MSYKLKTYDGTLLVDLIDGKIDNATTDITLVGKSYTGYGTFLNENFIYLLENFASTNSPVSPLTGQLWYDKSEGRLKVFDGTIFRSTDSTIVSSTQPAMVAGDLWLDTANKQLYFSDGINVYLAGPNYTYAQGQTGLDATTIVDQYGNNKVVSRLLINNIPVAIISKDAFTTATPVTNFGSNIQSGINVSSLYSDFAFHGIADSTKQLLDSSNNIYTPNDFLKTGYDNTTTGTLHVKNANGLLIGDNNDLLFKIANSTVYQTSQYPGNNYRLQITQGSSIVDALTVINSTSRMGIWQSNPQYGLDITGDVHIAGSLQVDGATTNLDVQNLRVQDKVIELAINADSSLLLPINLDGAGIIVKASGDDKTWTWNYTYNSWDSSVNINVPSGYSYKINHTDILTSTTLASSVTSAVGLTEIGTLQYLNVDNFNLNNSTLSTSNPLIISSAGDIFVSTGVKIYGVATPSISDDPSSVSTIEYVDVSHTAQNVYLSLDITGLTDNQIALVINDMVPAATKQTGVYAYVHCTYYTGTHTYNAGAAVNKTFVAVDSNGVQNQSVIEDFSFSNVTDTVTLTVHRSLKRFIVDGTHTWVFEHNLTSSV